MRNPLMCVCVSLSVVSDSLRPHGLLPIMPQAPLSMGFSGKQSWSGLLFPSPADLSSLGIEPGSLVLQVDSLPSELPGKPDVCRVLE